MKRDTVRLPLGSSDWWQGSGHPCIGTTHTPAVSLCRRAGLSGCGKRLPFLGSDFTSLPQLCHGPLVTMDAMDEWPRITWRSHGRIRGRRRSEKQGVTDEEKSEVGRRHNHACSHIPGWALGPAEGLSLMDLALP